MKRFWIFVLVLVFALAAFGQEVEPRGFDTPTTATETTATAAPATTETTAEAVPAVSAEPTPAPAAPANEAYPIDNEQDQRLAALENQPRVDTKKLDEILAQLQNDVKQPQKSTLPWYVWVLLLVLFVGEIALLSGKAPKAKPEPRRITPEPEPDHDFDRGRRGPGPGTTAALVALLGIGMIAHNASAECKISAISNGSVIVKEQKPADFALQLSGCDKEVKTIVAAASGITFTDISPAKGKVTAKVVADKSAETGPTLIKVTFADNSEVISNNSVFALILDPATATVRKDAIAAKAEATNARKEVKKLEAKVEKVAQDVATRPTTAQVQATVNPLETRIVQLEAALASVKAAQMQTAERVALLSRAAELLAEGQATIANKRLGWFRRPLNPSVAESADNVRQAVATPSN